ncbi:MAG: hypothetical protein QM739_15740 [Propionivibrio sp.]
MILNGLNDEGAVGDNVGMNDPQPIDPRRRIRELLAIPDRDRTDAEWDELNELEIRTAPGNREVPERAQDKRFNQPSPGHPKRQDRKQERKNSNGAINPRPEARSLEQRQEAKPQENRNQEGRNDGRPPRRQHRRPKRTPGSNGGNGGAVGGNGAGNGGSGNVGGGDGSVPAA